MTSNSSDFAAESGDGYELQMGRFSRRLAPRFLDFAGTDDAGVVLDAGCGTGALSVELLHRTGQARIVGVDISAAYVAHAESSVSDRRISFKVADLTALPFADRSFDQVVSQLVLDFVPDTTAALMELQRVSKPGGLLACAVWDARGGLVFNRLFLDTAAVLDPAADGLRGKNCTRPLRRPGQLEEAITSLGFSHVQVGEIAIRTDFESFDDYWSPFDGRDGPIPAYLSTRPPELKATIKEAVRRAYLDGEEDGLRSYTATAWAVRGRAPL